MVWLILRADRYRRRLARALERRGIAFDMMSAGEGVVTRLNVTTPRIVLADAVLPGMSIGATIEWIRKARGGQAVLIAGLGRSAAECARARAAKCDVVLRAGLFRDGVESALCSLVELDAAMRDARG